MSVKNKESRVLNSVGLHIDMLEKIGLRFELNLMMLVLILASLKVLEAMNQLLYVLMYECTPVQVLNAIIP